MLLITIPKSYSRVAPWTKDDPHIWEDLQGALAVGDQEGETFGYPEIG
jgi:hypothetical protein